MAKPNYAFEKRQRELEKKKKKEAKAHRKVDSNPGDDDTVAEPQTTDSEQTTNVGSPPPTP